MKVSLVMSTLGRVDEVLHFIGALDQLDHDDFELVIVDQNCDERLLTACQAMPVNFALHYLRCPHAKGLSRGRNIGIAKASGEVLCFPDDDCWYPPALIKEALDRFEATGADIVCGRAAALDGRSINGRFETSSQTVDVRNVFTTQIEWVVFFRRHVFEKLGGYDEAIGVGAATPWQSCEGPDITIRAIRAGFKVHYDPLLYAHHPELDTRHPDDAMRAKGRRYARGMGHVIRKHSLGLLYLAHYLVRPVGGACLSLLKGNPGRGAYYLNVALGRAEGYAGVCLEQQRGDPKMLIPMSNSKRVKELARWAYGLSSFCASPLLKKKHRFTKLTPGVFSEQLMYDRSRRSFFTVKSRDDIDVAVVRQIFINEDYAVESPDHAQALLRRYDAIIASGKKPLIIDCGGNSGLATRYFSETYPGSVLVCIEPEERNMAMARTNNPDPNIQFLLAGIGNCDARADIVDPGEGNWGYRTETSEQGKTRIISVNSILASAQYAQCTPLIIKIDIEGFEENLFEKNVEWLDAFPLLIIELHDWMLPRRATSNNFLRAISERNRDFIYRNENVFSISNTLP